jgi:hypothetical protein
MLRLEPKEPFDAGEVALPRSRAERIGPYVVVRELSRAPGARFVEADGPGDARVLLQVVRLRAPADEADRVARQRYERALGARTAALFDEPELEIRAQGGADLGDGTRWIYWARAWSGAPVELAALAETELLDALRALGDRLVRRHARGRAEPLLSAQALWRSADGRVGVAGVPVGVDAHWMAPTEDAPLRAPGEPVDATPSGDLWRMARVVEAAIADRTPPPALLVDLLARSDRLSTAAELRAALGGAAKDDPTQPTRAVSPPRPTSSWADALPSRDEEVTVDVRARTDEHDAATTRIELSPPPPPLVRVVSVSAPLEDTGETAAAAALIAPSVPNVVSAPGEANAPALVALVGPLDHGAVVTAPDGAIRPVLAATTPDRPLVPLLAPLPLMAGASVERPQATTAPDRPLALRPAADRADEAPPPRPGSSSAYALAAAVRAPIDSTELPTIDTSSPGDSATDPALGAAEAVTHQTRAVDLAPPVLPIVMDASEQSTSTQRIFSVDTVTDGKPLPRAGLLEEATVDPAAVAWAPALLPEGASPWSEVVRPRPARATFTGFPGELPELEPDDVIEPTAPRAMVRASEPPPPLLPSSAPLLPSPPLSPPLTEGLVVLTPARRMALAAGATLLVLGLVAQWSRGRTPPIEALDGLVLTATNEVTIDAQPAGTTVVSEADGRVLGQTPLRFVVPPAADASVLLVRAGHDPQRLVLPDRGGIVAILTPIAGGGCEVPLELPSGVQLEGVGAAIGSGPAYTIPGAAVVRAVGGGVVGARIVRCPEAPRDAAVRLRFEPPSTGADVRITHPAGATASIEGTEVGVVPASRLVTTAFARVRVAGPSGEVVERWVPSRSDVEVQVPTAVPVLAEPTVAAPTEVSVPEPAEREPRRERKPDALALLREGTEQLQAGHDARARERLEACLKADPSVAACHRGLAELHRRAEARVPARSHYQRYLELAPDAPDAPLVRSLLRELR